MENSTCTAIVPYKSEEQQMREILRQGEWLSRRDKDEKTYLNENGLTYEIIEKMCDLLPAFSEVKWSCDVLEKTSAKGDRPVSNFIPVPVEDIIYDDGNTQTRHFKIEGRKTKNFKMIYLPAVTVKAADLANMGWIIDKWGFDANIYPPYQSNKDLLRSVICTIGEKTAVRKNIFTHTGWRKINDKWCFLHGGGAIGADDVDVQLEGDLLRYAFPKEKLDAGEADKAFLTLMKIAKPEVIMPFVAVAFLTPLNEFLKEAGYEPAFVLNYVGRTQSRKSTLAALILSFFGKFNTASLPANFKDTANALEKKGFILKDMLMIVDDFHPASTINERKNMEQNMQALSRMYGDRRARSRLNYDITLRSGNIPRGNVAVTGEDVASIGQSGIARNFIVEIKPDDIPVSDELNAAQKYAADGYLSEFMRGYIEWLIPQAETLSEVLKNIFLSYRQRAIDEKLSGFGRTGDIVAWLMTGAELLSDFLVFRKIITADENYPEQVWEIFKKLVALQLDKSEETTPTAMFIESVRQLMECGKIYTETIGAANSFSGSKVGYCDTEFYYFIPDMIYGEVSRSSSSNGTAFPLSSRRIYKQLAAENITVTNDGKNTFQKRIGSRRGRYLCIPRGIIDNAA